MKIRISARASRQAREADAWWRANRGDRRGFVEELAHAIDLLAELPHLGAPYLPKAAFGVRRLLLVKSEHYLYYVVRPEERILRVLSIWSCHRGREPGLGVRKRV